MDQASKLVLHLPKEVDAVLITSPENRLYFTGSSLDGVLLLTRNPFYFFAASLDTLAAHQSIRDMQVLPLETGFPRLPEIAKKYSVHRIAVESEFLPVAELRRLRKRYPQVEFVVDDRVEAQIHMLRKQKTEYEIDCIQAAQSIADTVLEQMRSWIYPGITERELVARIEYELRLAGSERQTVICKRGEGPLSGFERMSDRQISQGEAFRLCIRACVKGYDSQITRTLFLPRPSEEEERAYQLLTELHCQALDCIRPGATGQELDQTVQEIFLQKGISENGRCQIAGHGIGVSKREAPTLSKDSTEELQTGMVLTVSTTLLVPGQFEWQMEDPILVTETGCRRLSRISIETL